MNPLLYNPHHHHVGALSDVDTATAVGGVGGGMFLVGAGILAITFVAVGIESDFGAETLSEKQTTTVGVFGIGGILLALGGLLTLSTAALFKKGSS